MPVRDETPDRLSGTTGAIHPANMQAGENSFLPQSYAPTRNATVPRGPLFLTRSAAPVQRVEDPFMVELKQMVQAGQFDAALLEVRRKFNPANGTDYALSSTADFSEVGAANPNSLSYAGVRGGENRIWINQRWIRTWINAGQIGNLIDTIEHEATHVRQNVRKNAYDANEDLREIEAYCTEIVVCEQMLDDEVHPRMLPTAVMIQSAWQKVLAHRNAYENPIDEAARQIPAARAGQLNAAAAAMPRIIPMLNNADRARNSYAHQRNVVRISLEQFHQSQHTYTFLRQQFETGQDVSNLDPSRILACIDAAEVALRNAKAAELTLPAGEVAAEIGQAEDAMADLRHFGFQHRRDIATWAAETSQRAQRAAARRSQPIAAASGLASSGLLLPPPPQHHAASNAAAAPASTSSARPSADHMIAPPPTATTSEASEFGDDDDWADFESAAPMASNAAQQPASATSTVAAAAAPSAISVMAPPSAATTSQSVDVNGDDDWADFESASTQQTGAASDPAATGALKRIKEDGDG